MDVLSYSPLAGGWLSGRYRQDTTQGPASVARQSLANRLDLELTCLWYLQSVQLGCGSGGTRSG
jgi:aryl-alcohol dehydrogenase-like predicted oxidoreductase